MAISKQTKIALSLLGAAVAGGTALFLSQPRPKAKKKAIAKEPCPPGQVDLGTDSFGNHVCGPAEIGEEPGLDLSDLDISGLGSLTATAVITPNKDEPLGGWELRWDQRMDQAIAWCRANKATSINSWTEFWSCVVERAFPEAAMIAVGERSAWWLDATKKARQDIAKVLQDDESSTQGWRFFLWLKFPAYVDGCYEALAPHSEAVAHCIATEIYPNESWSPPPKSGWKAQFWNALLAKIEQYETTTDQQPTRFST